MHALNYAEVRQRQAQADWPKPKRRLTLVLDNINDVQNLGAIYRLSDALGIQQIVMQQSMVINTKLKRIARQTHQQVPTQIVTDLTAYLACCQTEQDSFCVALELTNQSQSAFAIALQNQLASQHKIVLVAGNEQQGIHQSLLDLCETAIHIPMQGQNSSMNVAQAIGIVAAGLLFNH